MPAEVLLKLCEEKSSESSGVELPSMYIFPVVPSEVTVIMCHPSSHTFVVASRVIVLDPLSSANPGTPVVASVFIQKSPLTLPALLLLIQ